MSEPRPSRLTPLPWEIVKGVDRALRAAGVLYAIRDVAEGWSVAYFTDVDDDNARFILEACHAHDGLVARCAALEDALRYILDRDEELKPQFRMSDFARSKARDALKLALKREGGPTC